MDCLGEIPGHSKQILRKIFLIYFWRYLYISNFPRKRFGQLIQKISGQLEALVLPAFGFLEQFNVC